MKNAKECTSMDEIRSEIDRIDAAMIDLLAARSSYVDQAWKLKKQGTEQALVPWRVRDVIDKVRARAIDKGVSPDLAEIIWQPMIDWFIGYEAEKLKK